MPFIRSVLAFLVCASVASADDVLRTLDNKTVAGTLVGLSDKEVSIKLADSTVVKTPLELVIALDLRPIKGVVAGTAYSVIGLVDDTALLCSKYAVKGKTVEATLLTGQTITIPVISVTSILRSAEDNRLKQAFSTLLASKVKRDRVVIYKGGEVNDLQGTLG